MIALVDLSVITVRRMIQRRILMSDTTEEWFDVVDENDQVIDQMRRADVHRLKLRHRSVHIFVWRSDGRLLIHKRTESKEEFPGVWTSSASGHVSSGEGYAIAADRELTEELGFTAELRRCHKFAACPDTCMEFTELFECQWDGDVTPDPGEIQKVEWVDRAELTDDMRKRPEKYSPAFRMLIEWYCKQA